MYIYIVCILYSYVYTYSLMLSWMFRTEWISYMWQVFYSVYVTIYILYARMICSCYDIYPVSYKIVYICIHTFSNIHLPYLMYTLPYSLYTLLGRDAQPITGGGYRTKLHLI